MSSEKDIVAKATHEALKMMKNAGFEISDKLEVIVDPNLPFMGYSTKRDSGDVIVIANRALESGSVEALLIHEMSHIYRTNTNHPSHNRELLNKVGYTIIRNSHLKEDYQIKVIQQAVNHVQDLYADDVAFRVFHRSKAFTPNQAFDFFLDWINDEPTNIENSKTMWQNVGTMLNNCFVLSNMIRHNVPDADNQAENKVQKSLSQTNEPMKEEFSHFRDFMINLKESVTEREFERKLTEYLRKIVDLANRLMSSSH